MSSDFQVIIIGSGFAGMCVAIKLKEAGISDILMLERDEKPGGTWWRNSYPGAAVDVQSRLYSFSFEPWDWSRLFAERDEIYAYTKHVFEKHSLGKFTRCNANVTSATWGEVEARWTIEINHSEKFSAPILVNASGGLSQPAIPDIEGQDIFEGRSFHTSRWDNSFDYSGKRIAVVGTGASGIQVIPEVAKSAAQVTVFQRTPHWILPRPDHLLSSFERNLMNISPIRKIVRLALYLILEFRVLAFSYFPKLLDWVGKPEALKNLRENISDPDLRAKLTPDFRIGCKRILLNSDFYPSLNRENVELVTSSISKIEPKGISTTDGRFFEADLIVYATGFLSAEKNIPYPVLGRNGVSIQDEWKDGAHAWAGMCIPHFPNLFMMMGPNTGTGHTSVLVFIESQVKLIVDAVRNMKRNSWRSVEIKSDVEKIYNEKIQRKLSKTVWMTGGCQSWYMTASGRNTTLFPSFSFVYRRMVRKFRKRLFIVR